jgi:hypothetical protein
MPQRTFRIFLSNNTDHCLVRISHHLDHGEWTSGEWTPPPTIPPRSERGWQSESDGFATGTEGYAEYRPRVLPGPLLGGGQGDPCTQPEMADLVRITWNNPFLANPLEGKLATWANGGVSVDNDFDRTAFDCVPSAFTNLGDNYPLDLFSLAKQVPFAPVIIFGTITVVPHAEQHFTFREKHSVRQSLALGYDATRGVGRLCAKAGVNSVRTAFRIR